MAGLFGELKRRNVFKVGGRSRAPALRGTGASMHNGSLAADNRPGREQGSLLHVGGRSRAPALRGTGASLHNGSLAADKTNEKSIAVLPFVNLSSE